MNTRVLPVILSDGVPIPHRDRFRQGRDRNYREYRQSAFTLLELLVVTAIIGLLMSLLFPAIQSAKEGEKRARAASELQRICSAVSAYRTEYGRFPNVTGEEPREQVEDVAVGEPRIGLAIPNRELFYALGAEEKGLNTRNRLNYRRVVFFEGPTARDTQNPRKGFLRAGSSDSPKRDCYFDPWGRQYCVVMDLSRDGAVELGAGGFTGENSPRTEVAAFSVGADQRFSSRAEGADVGSKESDDILSWK